MPYSVLVWFEALCACMKKWFVVRLVKPHVLSVPAAAAWMRPLIVLQSLIGMPVRGAVLSWIRLSTEVVVLSRKPTLAIALAFVIVIGALLIGP